MTSVIRRRKSRSRFDGTWPSTRASPPVGWSRPESILSVVVLPAPFGPRKPTRSPGAISNEMPSTARTSRVRRRTRLFVGSFQPLVALGDLEDLEQPVDAYRRLHHPLRLSFPWRFA